METLTYKGITIDSRFIDRLSESLNDIHAFEYNHFLNDSTSQNCSVMDLIFELNRNTISAEQKQDVLQTSMPLQQQFELVIELFSHFGLGEKVKLLLEKKDPNYKVTISSDISESKVGHRGHNTFLEFNVSSKPTAKSAAILAHELAHAMSSHHIKMIELTQAMFNAETKFGSQSVEFLNKRRIFREKINNRSNFSNSAIIEIESHIIEKLFVYMLKSKEIISEEELNEYLISLTNSLKSNLTLIIEENDILHELDNSVTIESLNSLYLKSEKSGKTDSLAKRLFTMAERAFSEKPGAKNKHSEHMFRYVVGEIVSTLWMEKYLRSSVEERIEMFNQFVQYLNHTHELNLTNFSEKLFGIQISFETMVTDYLKLTETKQNNV